MIELNSYRLRWLIPLAISAGRRASSKTIKINIVARNVSMIGGRFARYFPLLGRDQLSRKNES
jgi:hypothetical protein